MKRLFILTVCLCLLFSLEGCLLNENSEPDAFRWVEEESHLVDYQVEGDRIRFRYAFCFENETDHEICLSSFTARFRKNDCEDWLRYEEFYSGTSENGENDVLIEKESKMNVIFVFEGEYLGGTVNETLLADDIAMIQRIVYESE